MLAGNVISRRHYVNASDQLCAIRITGAVKHHIWFHGEQDVTGNDPTLTLCSGGVPTTHVQYSGRRGVRTRERGGESRVRVIVRPATIRSAEVSRLT